MAIPGSIPYKSEPRESAPTGAVDEPGAENIYGKQGEDPRYLEALLTMIQNAGNEATFGLPNMAMSYLDPQMAQVVADMNKESPRSALVGSAAGLLAPGPQAGIGYLGGKAIQASKYLSRARPFVARPGLVKAIEKGLATDVPGAALQGFASGYNRDVFNQNVDRYATGGPPYWRMDVDEGQAMAEGGEQAAVNAVLQSIMGKARAFKDIVPGFPKQAKKVSGWIPEYDKLRQLLNEVGAAQKHATGAAAAKLERAVEEIGKGIKYVERGKNAGGQNTHFEHARIALRNTKRLLAPLRKRHNGKLWSE